MTDDRLRQLYESYRKEPVPDWLADLLKRLNDLP
jgi:hypothetical protein